MSIPASRIVDVQPRVISAGSDNLEFNGLFLTDNELISTDALVLEFPSVRTVGNYFGVASPEYAAAQTYFAGYFNKFSSPRAIFFARRINGLVAAWVRSGPNTTTLEEFKEVTDGSIKIHIDGSDYTYTDIDLSAATSFSDVCDIIGTKIDEDPDGPSVYLNYSSLNGTFLMESMMLSEDSEVGYPANGDTGTGLATLMSFTEAQGAIHSSGSGPMTPTEQMQAITNKTENFVTFTTMYEAEYDEMLELAQWSSTHYGWLYCPWTTDPNTVIQESTADPATRLRDANVDYVAITYGPLIYTTFLMGAIGSIAWLRTNGTITLAFKRQSGLSAYVLTEDQAAVLESKNCNYFGNFATRNAEIVFLYNGCLTNTQGFRWIDPYINSVWLNNRFQVALIDMLTTAGRVPHNERGYTQIIANLQDPITEALNNGAIETGVLLSESQKSEVMQEAGLDISNELYNEGVYIQVLESTAVERAGRVKENVNIWYCYGGAIHRIIVNSTAVL